MKQFQNTSASLSERRKALESQWDKFVTGNPFPGNNFLRQDIVSSWRRSASHITPLKTQAPTIDDSAINRRWQSSPLSQAVKREESNIIQLAREGQLVAAIADPQGQLMWTCPSSFMRKRAEAVNFVAGGCWNERSVGTNAVGLSLKLKQSVTVFSSEHYQPFVHDWVCYAAPIVHPQTGDCVGILDISTTWKSHTPLGQAAVTELARSIASCLPDQQPLAELELYAMGQPRVMFRGKSLQLTRRQLEVLCLLALNPQGLNLESLHAAMYGDEPTSTNTLKAELSHLRRILQGQIGSRPYRLLGTVWADFIEIWQALNKQNCHKAISLYRGPLLSQSCSPELEEWRRCIDAVMGQTLNDCDDTVMLMKGVCSSGSSGSEMVRERLMELIPQPVID